MGLMSDTGRGNSGKVAFGFDIDPDAMLIDKMPAQNAGDEYERGRHQRNIKAEGQQVQRGILEAQQPVERCQRQRHDREYGVTPSGDQAAYEPYGHQVDQADESRQPAAPCARARQPETGAGPEFVLGINISNIRCHQSQQRRYRKMDQCRVDRVSGNGHMARDRFLRHGYLSWCAGSISRYRLVVLMPLVLVVGCSGPQSALDPAGPAARAAAGLWWGMFGFSLLVLALVVFLWLYATARKAEAMDDKASRKLGQRWIIGGGLLLPFASILALLLFGIPAGHRMLPLPLGTGDVKGDTGDITNDTKPLRVDVIGHQWWWEVQYPETGVITANELHLPVDVPVNIRVTSADVIHSFWIPSLGGKIDVLPGRTNVLRLEASRRGSFRGQCAEFCGSHHAHMALAVEVHSRDDFDSWLRARQQPLAVDADMPAIGAFKVHCGSCHRVAGISVGASAPDLTTVGARRLLGGRPRRDYHAVAHWLKSAEPGNRMPDHRQMAPQFLEDIALWLETLGLKTVALEAQDND
jgi:cytochrome c oxidase subunit 2